MFCTETLPAPVKISRSIPLQEVYLLFQFGSRNMADNMSSTLADNCAETLYQKMYLLSEFCGCTSFRKGDLVDC